MLEVGSAARGAVDGFVRRKAKLPPGGASQPEWFKLDLLHFVPASCLGCSSVTLLSGVANSSSGIT